MDIQPIAEYTDKKFDFDPKKQETKSEGGRTWTEFTYIKSHGRAWQVGMFVAAFFATLGTFVIGAFFMNPIKNLWLKSLSGKEIFIVTKEEMTRQMNQIGKISNDQGIIPSPQQQPTSERPNKTEDSQGFKAPLETKEKKDSNNNNIRLGQAEEKGQARAQAWEGEAEGKWPGQAEAQAREGEAEGVKSDGILIQNIEIHPSEAKIAPPDSSDKIPEINLPDLFDYDPPAEDPLSNEVVLEYPRMSSGFSSTSYSDKKWINEAHVEKTPLEIKKMVEDREQHLDQAIQFKVRLDLLKKKYPDFLKEIQWRDLEASWKESGLRIALMTDEELQKLNQNQPKNLNRRQEELLEKRIALTFIW